MVYLIPLLLWNGIDQGLICVCSFFCLNNVGNLILSSDREFFNLWIFYQVKLMPNIQNKLPIFQTESKKWIWVSVCLGPRMLHFRSVATDFWAGGKKATFLHCCYKIYNQYNRSCSKLIYFKHLINVLVLSPVPGNYWTTHLLSWYKFHMVEGLVFISHEIGLLWWADVLETHIHIFGCCSTTEVSNSPYWHY